eukprot:1613950-Rhodomonas_salina.1
MSAALERELGHDWDCHWETPLAKMGLLLLDLGAGRDIGLGEKSEGGIGSMVQDGVLDAGPKRKLTVVA